MNFHEIPKKGKIDPPYSTVGCTQRSLLRYFLLMTPRYDAHRSASGNSASALRRTSA